MTDLEICNLALTKLGQNRISAFTENSEPARLCNIFYEQTRDMLLREHNWNFATKIEALNLIANEEIINYDYLYSFPSKCLFIMQVFDENKTEINEYEILLTTDTNTKCIASNTELAYIKYIKKITDTSKYDSLFIDALANKLAYELTMSLTGSQDTANNFLQLYNLSLNNAKRINMQEKHKKQTKVSQYLEVR